jgi:hypothetical protein
VLAPWWTVAASISARAADRSRPASTLSQLSYFAQLRPRAAQLAAAGCTAAEIAESLNAEGPWPPKRAAAFIQNSVRDLLGALGLQHARTPASAELGEHEWCLRDLASHLGMSKVTLDAWIRRGWADGYLHPGARLIVVRADPAEAERFRAPHQVPRGQHNRRPWPKNQAALMNTEREGTDDNADEPQL